MEPVEAGQGMEGSSKGTSSCTMAFGDNSSGLCPIMMTPLVTSYHGGHHPTNPDLNNNLVNAARNSLFLPISGSSNDHHPNHNTSGLLGSYFMENDHNNDGISSSSSSVKAKIMAHPHYHRLLATYANCQKVS